MKVFITAVPGVGKSAVINELVGRGYTAYDADDSDLNLTRLEVKATGEHANWPKGFVDWTYYAWNANEARLQELLARNDTVFIAGILGNQRKLYHYFDRLIALVLDDPVERERRLNTRPKREFGDDDKNNQRRLERYSKHMAKFASSGLIMVDNAGPIEDTVDQIERITGLRQEH